MGSITGVVSDVQNRGRGKGSHIVVNGNKYGCFDPAEVNLDSIQVGDEVTFDSSQNGNYTNIVKNTLRKTGNTGPVSAPPVSNRGGASYAGKQNFSKTFPVPTLDGQRSIIRQNSLTHATAVVNASFPSDSGMTVDERADEVLRIAAMFEYFSAGDDIAEAADAALKAMGTPND